MTEIFMTWPQEDTRSGWRAGRSEHHARGTSHRSTRPSSRPAMPPSHGLQPRDIRQLARRAVRLGSSRSAPRSRPPRRSAAASSRMVSSSPEPTLTWPSPEYCSETPARRPDRRRAGIRARRAGAPDRRCGCPASFASCALRISAGSTWLDCEIEIVAGAVEVGRHAPK